MKKGAGNENATSNENVASNENSAANDNAAANEKVRRKLKSVQQVKRGAGGAKVHSKRKIPHHMMILQKKLMTGKRNSDK